MTRAPEAAKYDGAVVVALGSNLGDTRRVLEAALGRFDSLGLRVDARSLWWRSDAWPDPNQPPFLNGVALVATALPPQAVLQALLEIEIAFGRLRASPNAPRTLDLDLIAHGRQVVERPDLTLPHPRAHRRLFVMGPLAEIAPEWQHPVSGATAVALAATADQGRDAVPEAL